MILAVAEDSFLFRNGSGGDVVRYNARTGEVDLFFEASILVSGFLVEISQFFARESGAAYININ